MTDAVRLIFSYEGSDVTVISRQRIDVVLPPSEPLDVSTAERSGFWIEVRDTTGAPLHRQLMHDPIRHDAEVFSDDPSQTIARVPVEHPSGVFSVVVPAAEEADHVALMGTPLEERPAVAAARELATFSLKDDG